MVKYAFEVHDPANTVRSKISNAKVSFKNTRETSRVLINRTLDKAIKYLKDVINKKQCVPMRRYARGISRTAQANAFKTQRGRWPVKSAEFFIKLIDMLKKQSEAKELNPSEMIIKNIVVNKAPIIPGRTYRAYGRINPFNKQPCHIQVVAIKKETVVPEIIEGETIKEISH